MDGLVDGGCVGRVVVGGVCIGVGRVVVGCGCMSAKII